MTEEVKFVLSADDAKATEALKRTKEGLDGLGAAAKKSSEGLKTTAKGAEGLATATALTRHQMQQLNFQLTDIVTSLVSGQSPFTVLVQQGGQLKDTFGGVGGALRAVASVFTLGRIAAIGFAGGLTAVATAAIQGWQESTKLRDVIALTGNAAGITEGKFRSLTERIAATSTATIGDTRAMTLALVSTGRFGGTALESVVRAATQLQRVSGASSDDIVKDFARMQQGVAKWAAEANERYHFLDIETFKLIQRQEKLGHTQEALRITFEALAKPLEKQQQNLGTLEKAWLAVNKAASQAWDSMLNIGRADTVEQQIDKVKKLIEANGRRTDFDDSIGPNGPRKGASTRGSELQLELANLVRQRRDQLGAADLASVSAMQNQVAIDKALQPAKPMHPDYLGQMEDAFKARIWAWQERDQNARDKWDFEDDALDRMEEDNKRRLESWQETNQQMLDAARPEWAKLAESWENVTDKMAEVGKRFTDGFVDAGRDAFQEFLRSGKLSADGFKNLVIQTLTELIYDRVIAKQMGTFGDMLWSYIGQGFSGSGGSWGFGGGSTGGDTGGGFGGDSVTAGAGASMSAASSSRKRATGVTINQTINVGQGASYGEVYAAARVAKDAAVSEIEAKIVRGNPLFNR